MRVAVVVVIAVLLVSRAAISAHDVAIRTLEEFTVIAGQGQDALAERRRKKGDKNTHILFY